MTAEQWVIIMIGIIGCLIIYIWQHRDKYDYEVHDEMVNALQKYKDDILSKYYDDYLTELVKVGSSNLVESTEAWGRVITMIEEHLPFFKTGYITTLILGDDRYLKLSQEDPDDVDVIFNELKSMIGEQDKDVERIADLTVIVLSWYRRKLQNDSRD